jgi:hypothetical protein
VYHSFLDEFHVWNRGTKKSYARIEKDVGETAPAGTICRDARCTDAGQWVTGVAISDHHFSDTDIGRGRPVWLPSTGLIVLIALLWALAGAADVLTH